MTNNCNHPRSVHFNPTTGVVQCHSCGCVWTPITQEAGEPYYAAVCREVERLKDAEPECDEHEWLWPWSRRGDEASPCNGCLHNDAKCQTCEHKPQPAGKLRFGTPNRRDYCIPPIHGQEHVMSPAEAAALSDTANPNKPALTPKICHPKQ